MTDFDDRLTTPVEVDGEQLGPRPRLGRERLSVPAREKPLPDIVAEDLLVLFCGINPSLASAQAGHHFARPGNRFWPALHRSGLTPRRLAPDEDRRLLDFRLGSTNLVDRPTRAASELSPDELRAGAAALERLTDHYAPRVVAVVGITAYRTAFERPRAKLGLQPERLAARPLWVVPNPSGLNAHHQLPDLARLFAELGRFAREAGARGGP
jgi:TDG/mug DNA glycosylase family protein